MNRYKFEKLIQGKWEDKNGDRYRQNGKFKTYVRKPWKYLSDGNFALRAKSWEELATILKMGKNEKEKVGGKVVSNLNENNWIRKRAIPKTFSNRKNTLSTS